MTTDNPVHTEYLAALRRLEDLLYDVTDQQLSIIAADPLHHAVAVLHKHGYRLDISIVPLADSIRYYGPNHPGTCDCAACNAAYGPRRTPA